MLLATAIGGQAAVRLSYLGTAGWEITDGKTVILIDPYLSRVKSRAPNDDVSPDDPRPAVSRDDVIQPDAALIDAHIQRADFILITHTHADHVVDTPYIARKTGAMVIGTQSTANFVRVSGVPNARILAAKGGEDLEFGVFSVRVVPSLHGILRRAPNVQPGSGPPPPLVFPPDAKPPIRFRDLVEGGTLAYLVRLGGVQILAFGSMNYIEREVDGLRPDVALIGAMPERREIYNYTPRLLKALGYPRIVLPAHWDRFNVPYSMSQQPAIDRLQSFLSEVKAASPKTRVIVPKYFEPVSVEPTGK